MAAKPIQCKAAVAWAANEPLRVETITVDPPQAGEVRVRILYTSVCHTDQYTLSGADSESNFPCILGHEGAGQVESVGPGVESVAVGDHVIPLYIPQCRQCEYCKHPRTNLCQSIRAMVGKGVMADGSTRMSCNGKPIYFYMGTSTFSEYTVIPEIAIAKVGPEQPLDRLCLLGCGLSTGYGAAVNTANVQAGETCAIFGLGAVGLAVVVACRKLGASRIIGIDLNDKKRELAKQFGCTEFLNPIHLPAGTTVQQHLVDLTKGGLDQTFECVGNVNTMKAALESAHKGWGRCTVVGVAAAGHELSFRPFLLVTGRTLTGSAFGGWKSRDSMPKLVELYTSGALPVDQFITQRRSGLESLNEVFDLLKSGDSLRCVVDIGPAKSESA